MHGCILLSNLNNEIINKIITSPNTAYLATIDVKNLIFINMDEKSNEQNRITLSIAFIATYLTLIIGFSEKIRTPVSNLNIANDIAFVIFIVFGIWISFLFFLYLVFTALELDFHKKKEVLLDQEVSKEKIHRIRKSLYNAGVRWIFVSFSYPVYYLLAIFQASYSWRLSFLLWVFCLALVFVLLHIIFRDRK